MSLNAKKMKNFVCATCQLTLVDPLQIPVQTLATPFRVHQLEPSEIIKFQYPAQAKVKFEVSEELIKAYKSSLNTFKDNRKKFFIQMRCLRMNGTDGVLAHDFPQFGQLRVNGKGEFENRFHIDPPPNDKKRHDKFLDISNWLKAGENYIEIV